MESPEKDKASDPDNFRVLKHDIKNQLSNIYLALDQLRFELHEVSDDCKFYMDAILMSSDKIVDLLKEEE
jgi:nitrogen-specific signal transduction histidine kinase